MLMTASDVSAITKPWEVQKKVRIFTIFTLFKKKIMTSLKGNSQVSVASTKNEEWA